MFIVSVPKTFVWVCVLVSMSLSSCQPTQKEASIRGIDFKGAGAELNKAPLIQTIFSKQF